MPLVHASLISDDNWVPMRIDTGQDDPRYMWWEGGTLKDAPVDFAKTFAQNMFSCAKPINVPRFNRNPLRVVPNFVVPRHHHNIDETIIVFQGEYYIDHGEGADRQTTVVKPGNFFTSRAGTPYTMTAGPEGVTYIETWGCPVPELKTVWYAEGWVPR
jgi:mannose-6-phosphate isomerase-like protein (cupin superfamily)